MQQLELCFDVVSHQLPTLVERGIVFESSTEDAPPGDDLWHGEIVSFNSSWNWVYFIEAIRASSIKIGISMNPTQRLRQLGTESPHELQLLVAAYGSLNDERRLHERFRQHRTRGEWFAKHVDIVDAVESIKTCGRLPR